MQTGKQVIQETMDQLPDDTDLSEIVYRLQIIDDIRKAQKAVENGETITSEELKREIETW